MNKFEKNIKDAVEGYEAPYSADAWQSLNKAMGPSKATLLKWVASSAALLTLAVVGYTYFDQPDAIITEELVAETIHNKDSKAFIKKIENSIYDANGQFIQKEEITDDSDFKLVTEHTPSSETNTVEANIVEPIIEVKNTPEVLTPNEVSSTTSADENQKEPKHNTEVLKASVITSNTTQCLTNEFTFTPSVPKQNAIYEWHLGDGTIINGSVANHKYDMAGHYLVELVLRDLKTREIIKTSPSVEITVLEVPNTSFTNEQSVTIEPITYFRNTTTDYKTLVWEIENLKTSSLENFEYSFKNKGRFTVNLTATNENGCSTKTSEVITIEQNYNLLAPTAFSPNGDNLNDDFMPKALPLMQLPFTLTIYDRQGKLVYQTTDSSQPWDGISTQDGTLAPNGVYVWVCQLTKENGETEIYQNQIIIAK
jgi:gliding motility-associated-like protein